MPLRPPDWRFDPDELRRAFSPRTKAIIVNTPNNPTGHIFTREELTLIAELCQEYDAYALADEIYEYIRLHRCAAHQHRHAAGHGRPHRDDQRAVEDVQHHRLAARLLHRAAGDHQRHPQGPRLPDGRAPHPLQMAGAAALALPQSYYDQLRNRLPPPPRLFLPYLREAGFTFYEPEGAYYVMTDIGALGWQRRYGVRPPMIREIGVSAVPGSSFYSPQELGKTMVRFMFAKRDETLHQAGERLLKLRALAS